MLAHVAGKLKWSVWLWLPSSKGSWVIGLDINATQTSYTTATRSSVLSLASLDAQKIWWQAQYMPLANWPLQIGLVVLGVICRPPSSCLPRYFTRAHRADSIPLRGSSFTELLIIKQQPTQDHANFVLYFCVWPPVCVVHACSLCLSIDVQTFISAKFCKRQSHWGLWRDFTDSFMSVFRG